MAEIAEVKQLRDIDHRNSFRRYALIVSVPLLFFFLVLNLFQGDFRDALLCLSGLLVAVFGISHRRIVTKSESKPELPFALLSLILLLGVLLRAGDDTILYWLYSAPPLYFAVLGKQRGLNWAFAMFGLTAACLLLPVMFVADWYSLAVSTRFLITFGFTLALAYGTEATRYYLYEQWQTERHILSEKKQSLESALTELKVLSGLLPICTRCKKIHNESGEWQDIADYIKENSEADFSHGICPDCAELLYSETIPDSS